MKISIVGRQFEITPSIREYVEQHISAMIEAKTLSITNIRVMMAMEKNHFTTTVIVSCKYRTVPAEVTDFDLYKSFDGALQKVDSQLNTIKEKLRAHQTVPLCESEAQKAAQAQEETKAAEQEQPKA